MSDERIIEISTLDELVQSCLESTNSSLLRRTYDAQPIGFQGRFSAKKSSRFNAYARQIVGMPPVYSITYGAMLGILDICMEIAANPKFISEIQDTDAVYEKPSISSDERFRNYPALTEEQPALDYLTRVPSGQYRQSVGWYLFGFSMRFVSLHEQGHYLNGHIRLLDNDISELAEESVDTSQELTEFEKSASSVRRALELEADIFAHHNAVMFGACRWDEYYADASLYSFIPTRADWCLLQFLGASLVGLLLSHLSQRDQTKESLHPSPDCRIYSLMQDFRAIRSKLQDIDAVSGKIVDSDENWDRAFERTFLGLQIAADALGGKTSKSLEDVLSAFVNQTSHPGSDEYFDLVRVLNNQRTILNNIREMMKDEIDDQLIIDR